jgi:hypothetical protein
MSTGKCGDPISRQKRGAAPKKSIFYCSKVVGADDSFFIFIPPTPSRVARFILTQYTKTGGNVPNCH